MQRCGQFARSIHKKGWLLTAREVGADGLIAVYAGVGNINGEGNVRSPGLGALVDDAVFIALEAQVQLLEEIEEDHSWTVDMASGLFRIEQENTLEYGVQLIGTSAPSPRSWLWGWANPSGYDASVLRCAEATKTMGERYSIPELTEAEVPFDEDDDNETQPEPGYAMAYDFTLAARVASKTWFGYSGRIEGGTRVWMLLDGPAFAPPTLARTMRVLAQGLATTQVGDHNRAITSYAVWRDLPWDGSVLKLPDGSLRIEMDGQGRIKRYSAEAES